jgi:hypothetical protein
VTRTSMRRLALLLTASLAMLLGMLALTSTASAEIPFCGGQTINNHQTCFGTARTFEYVVGTGTSTGVCVGYNEQPFGGCSSGGGVLTAYDIGSYGFRNPKIIGISPNNTTVQLGGTF